LQPLISDIAKLAGCRFRGHENKIVTLELEDAGQAEVQPRVQA
jgi:hypothetical protein